MVTYFINLNMCKKKRQLESGPHAIHYINKHNKTCYKRINLWHWERQLSVFGRFLVSFSAPIITV